MAEQNGRNTPQETPEERFAALVENLNQKKDPNAAYQLALCWRDGTGTKKDEFGYLRMLIYADQLGNRDATKEIARVPAERFVGYAEALHRNERFGDAFLFFLTAGRLGLGRGWFGAGVMLQKGQGVEQDLGKAAQFYEKGAERGNSDCMLSLSIMYREGDGVPKDEKESFRWMLRAAESGDARAAWNLSIMYREGDGVPKDEKEAFRWVLRAAELGNELAMYWAAVQSYTGFGGVERDCERGLHWVLAGGEKVLAEMKARQVLDGIVGAAFDAGYEAIQAGDMAAAARQFRFAAEQGHPGAAWNLSIIYARGDGVPKDEKESFRWRVRAAELGDEKAMYHVARDYTYGWNGAEKNYDQARFWAQKAKESGELPADKSADDLLRVIENRVASAAIEAAYRAGTAAYNAGNFAEAFKQFQFVAETGNASGLFIEDSLVDAEDGDEPLVIRMGGTSDYIRNSNYNLGLMYFRGRGVGANKAKAAAYFEIAAKQGVDDAQVMAGLMYHEGTGVTKDQKKAADYLKMAALRKNAVAQFNLGCLYYDGIGVPRDRTKAKELLQKAAAKGNEDAKKALRKYF